MFAERQQSGDCAQPSTVCGILRKGSQSWRSGHLRADPADSNLSFLATFLSRGPQSKAEILQLRWKVHSGKQFPGLLRVPPTSGAHLEVSRGRAAAEPQAPLAAAWAKHMDSGPRRRVLRRHSPGRQRRRHFWPKGEAYCRPRLGPGCPPGPSQANHTGTPRGAARPLHRRIDG